MEIKILGVGCNSCKKLYETVLNTTKKLNIDANVIYITQFEEISKYNIMVTPALIINENVISTGKNLSEKEIESILKKSII